jgi:hypothetical protein
MEKPRTVEWIALVTATSPHEPTARANAIRRTRRSWGYARRWLFFAGPGNYKQST